MLLLLQNTLTDEKSWPLLGVVVLALAYIVLRPMLRRKKDPLDQPPGFKSLSQQRAVERTMQSLLVDLTEMARQISAQLDTRAARLEALIREADEKIAQLRSAGVSIGDASARVPQDQAHSGPHMRLVRTEPDSSNHSDGTQSDGSLSEASQIDPRHAEVYALADQGRDPREIAARLKRPSGEIELILALRPHGS